jgi:hypothetical protein
VCALVTPYINEGSKVLVKRRQHILVTLLRNLSSSAMAHYRIGIYNDNTIIPSIYVNPELRYANYLSTPQAYNTNVVDRSHVVMSLLSSHVNMHNSYSSVDMPRWSIIMLISLSMLATYIMDVYLLIHRLDLHRIVHHKLTCR